VARKRLAAIKEFSDLGSGFRVAALDLEIRGAGNLLGGQQSGHIEAIGFEMYMKLLEETIRELKGEELEDEVRTTMNLKVELRIDEAYIADMNQRLSVYRKVAQARSDEELDRVLSEVRDRFGPLPESMLVLAAYAQLRIIAERLRIETIDREGPVVVLRLRQDAPLDPMRLMKYLQTRADVRLLPPATLKLDLQPPVVAPRLAAGGESPMTSSPRTLRPGTWPGVGAPKSGAAALVREGRASGRATRAVPAPVSWWTVRATAGEVTGGFSREQILTPAAEAARAPGGVFERVGGLLTDLAALAH
jgi:transcription-repair coupling factor (superfamily II helicase)